MSTVTVTSAPRPADLAAHLAGPAPATGVELTWLGQAGFALRVGGDDPVTVLIDPYLSDTLADKYRGTLFPHTRLVSPPVAPDALTSVDLVLSTHGHTDHLDPGTLGPLAAGTDAVFVAPAAVADTALARGVPADRFTGADDGADLVPVPGVRVRALPAAHETLETDGQGRHRFLGYVVDLGGVRFYHSGDCVPYDDQAARLRALAPDVALLPVNGRDAHRLANGVPGNFTADEAVALCEATGTSVLVAHHWGLFAFNTVDPSTLPVRDAARRGVRLVVPELGVPSHLGGSST